MGREQEMLEQLTKHMEDYQNLNLQDINKMSLKEVNDLKDELSKIREEAALLYNQMRDYESLGDYNVDELQDFYRKYFDFENDMEKGFLNLGKRRTNIREYLADLLDEYREAQVDVVRVQGEIEENEFEIMDAKSKLATMERQLEYLETTYKNSLEKDRKDLEAGKTVSEKDARSREEAYTRETNKLKTEIEILKARVPELEKELENLKKKLAESEKRAKDLGEDIDKYKKGEKVVEQSEDKDKSETKKDTPSIFDEDPSRGNGSVGTTAGNAATDDKTEPTIENDDDLLPINDSEIIDVIDGKEYIMELDEEATMRNYSESGYQKNADGWYFDPSKDDYIEGYDPLEDPLFQKFEKKKKYIGKGLKGQVPTAGKSEKKDSEKPEKEAPEKEKENEVTHNVTINITGPEDKKTTIVVPVVDGKPLFETDENGHKLDTIPNRMFANACREMFGPDGHYRIKECTSDVEGFDLKTTPVKQDMTVDALIGRFRKVTFTNDDNRLATIYVEDGQYLDPNQIEQIDRAVNYGYTDVNQVGYQGNIKDQRAGGALKKAFTGLKYWGVAGTDKDDDKLDKFKFDQPITGDIDLVAETGIKAKSVAATVSGLAAGAALDLAGGPLAGRIGIAAAGVVDRVAKYKLTHHKEMIPYGEIAQMTGIKKANAKVKNYFRKTQNIKDLQFFCKSFMLGATAVEVGRGVKQLADYISSRNATPTGPTGNVDDTTKAIDDVTKGADNELHNVSRPLKDGNQFQYGYRDSYSAVGGNGSVHLNTTLTGQATPHSFYDTATRQWLPINDSALAQVTADPARYAVRYMSDAGDMMWEPAVEALENVGGMTL